MNFSCFIVSLLGALGCAIIPLLVVCAINYYRSKKQIYIICPVRNLTDEEKKYVDAYVDKLEKDGNSVRCPYRDTEQQDEIGYRIVKEHIGDVIWANEIHIWWNPTSTGSHVDLGQTFMADALMKGGKKICLINADKLEVKRDDKGNTKSYTHVILAKHYGLPEEITFEELKKFHEEHKNKA